MHQLRGRVGRGGEQSYCILMTGSNIKPESKKRMEIMVSTSNGFEIAEKDLEMRGPGDLYGTRQSGMLKFRLADIVQDIGILEQTRAAARQVTETDPSLSLPQHRPLKFFLRQQGEQSNWARIS